MSLSIPTTSIPFWQSASHISEPINPPEPVTIATDNIIAAKPKAIPNTDIRTIGRDSWLELPEPKMIRLARKRSVFKIY